MIRVLVLLVVTAAAIFPMFGINVIIQTKMCRETDFISSSFDDNGLFLGKLGGHSSEPSEQSFFPSSILLL